MLDDTYVYVCLEVDYHTLATLHMLFVIQDAKQILYLFTHYMYSEFLVIYVLFYFRTTTKEEFCMIY